MARSRLTNCAFITIRQPLPANKIQPFTSSYSTKSKSQANARGTAYKYVGLAVATIGGFGFVSSWSSTDHRPKSLPAAINAEDPDAPAWSTFTLQSRQKISPTSSVFTFKSSRPALTPTYYDSLFSNSIFAVDIAQPQIQIVREYTPLPPAIDPATGGPLIKNDCSELNLLIKKEPRGEVSGYIHGLVDGAEIRVSKPRKQVSLESIGAAKEVKTLVMVVGGTGITAALQAIHALLEAPVHMQKQSGSAILETRPYVHILWANRRREDCLGGISDTQTQSSRWWTLGGLLGGTQNQTVGATELGESPVIDEIRRLKAVHGERLQVDYFVDEENTFVTADSVQQALVSKPEGKAYVAISGPEGFMASLAGEKRVLKNKITARPSSGVLAELKARNWELMVLS